MSQQAWMPNEEGWLAATHNEILRELRHVKEKVVEARVELDAVEEVVNSVRATEKLVLPTVVDKLDQIIGQLAILPDMNAKLDMIVKWLSPPVAGEPVSFKVDET